jgi:hypothetical protein
MPNRPDAQQVRSAAGQNKDRKRPHDPVKSEILAFPQEDKEQDGNRVIGGGDDQVGTFPQTAGFR